MSAPRIMLIFGGICAVFAKYPPPTLDAYSQAVATVAIAAALAGMIETGILYFWRDR